MRTARLVFVAALLNVAMTCGVLAGPATETRPIPASVKDVFDRAREMLHTEGFDESVCDAESGYMRTEWRITEGVRYREMYRERVVLKAWREAKGTVASFSVEKEVNENAANPSSVARAMWISAGSNQELQDKFKIRLQNHFVPWRLED
ncbi:MAG: hypothetical protein ACYTAF_02810 [Planctomycetota bacterium]|jgi:hypothetical protein